MPSDNFGSFSNLLLNTGISDNRYPVKGCHIWLPYGFQFKEYVFHTAEAYVEGKGYSKYQFPRLIPGNAIGKVTANIDNFEEGLFWLRRKDETPLNMFLNPTGECGVYTMFQMWIRSEDDLPLRIYQRNSTFRPHKRPDAMLNGDELMDLLECHSAFATKNEADREFESITGMFEDLHERMGIPFLPLRRPSTGNKPVCTEMVSFETYIPSKGRSFNVGVIYNQGQIYSRAFRVEFSGRNGGKSNTFQTTFGLSERGIGAMLDLHRDVYGLRLLPQFAPEQISIIPVYGEKDGEVKAYVEKLGDYLGKSYNVHTYTDNSKKAGKKLATARMKGIPVRIGVSAQNVADSTVRVYLRTQEEPLDNFPAAALNKEMPVFFREIEKRIKEDARQYVQSRISDARERGDIGTIVADHGIARFNWCGDYQCVEAIERNSTGEFLGSHIHDRSNGQCISCGSEGNYLGFYSKRSSSP